MRAYFKLFGVIFLIISSTLIGFNLASKKRDYEISLFSILISLKDIKNKIRLKNGEITTLIPLCFDKAFVVVKDGKFIVSNSLLPEDRDKLTELFSSLGMSDCEGESKKCDNYIDFFEARYRYISNKNREECKLYKTLGFLSGVFLSIFLL